MRIIEMEWVKVLSSLAWLAAVATALPVQANDFPTDGRVEYVLGCIRKHPQQSEYEMRYKCSCAVDHIASQLTYDEYVELLTATLARTIGGERGAALRDAPETSEMVQKFRAIEGKANSACFIQ